MTSFPTAIRTVRWMVRDTFRQSLSSRLFWVMLGLTVLATLFCLGVSVTGDERRQLVPGETSEYLSAPLYSDAAAKEGIRRAGGEMSLGFGLFKFPIAKFRTESVRMIELWIAGIVADTAGVLLALLWTAGFLPTFLEPQAITVLLAKPVPRWSLIVGKYLGVALFVTLQAIFFVGGTWLGLGIATGVWDGVYWFAVPLLVINFAVFYAFSAFLAVWTRSTVVSVFGTLLFWILCWAMNFTHHWVAANAVPGTAPAASIILDIGYWTLPKPLDLSGIFFDAMRAKDFWIPVPEVKEMKERGLFHPELAVLSSLGFAVVVILASAYEFRETDY